VAPASNRMSRAVSSMLSACCGMQSQQATVVDVCVERLTQVGIQLVAIDLDQTLLDIHTGGAWAHSAVELVPHVRTEFRQLVPSLIDNNIKVAICTFSPQTELIGEVLGHVFGDAIAATIVVRGGKKLETEFLQYPGKQGHMASAVAALGTNITRATTVLVDDDVRNVRAALEHGTRAIWFRPQKPHVLWKDVKSLE